MSRREDTQQLQNEHELVNALLDGLQCAAMAAKSLGYMRQEGRYFQIGMLLGQMRDKCVTLANSKRMPSLLDANGMRAN